MFKKHSRQMPPICPGSVEPYLRRTLVSIQDCHSCDSGSNCVSGLALVVLGLAFKILDTGHKTLNHGFPDQGVSNH